MTPTTRVSRRIDAPRSRVYRALLDPADVARWRFPAGMTCEVHRFDAVQGGTLRVSLTYDDVDRAGKTTDRTDTYTGHFVRLVPDELVVEADAFETTDPDLAGEMVMTVRLHDSPDGGTHLEAVHEGLPPGVPQEQNQLGWEQALDRLAALVEPPGH